VNARVEHPLLDQLSRFILKYPRLLLSVIAAITLILGYHMPKLEVDFSIEQLFPEHDPDRQTYFDFRDDFALDDDVFLMVYETDNPFSSDNLELVRTLTEELEYMDGVEEIISLANIERMALEDDVLMMDYFLPEGLPEKEIESRKQELMDHPLYRNVVISGDGLLAGILVNVSDDFNTHRAREQIIAEIDSLRANIPWVWHDAGIPILRTRYVQTMNGERAIFLPMATAISLIVLYAMFRQRRALLYPLIAIGIALVWLAGIMALAHITINIVSYLAFNLLLIVGVSNAIHILVNYYEQLNQGLPLEEALREVIKRIGAALFLTSFTTATGFFSLITTNVRIIQEFGTLLALGVMLMFMLTIIIIPALLLKTPIPSPESVAHHAAGARFKAARKISQWNESHPRVILALSAGALLLSLVGISRVSTNAALLEDLRPGNKVYDDIHFIEQRMGNILPLEVVLDTGISGGITKPENLSSLHALQAFIQSLPPVGASNSIADHIRLLNEVLGSGERTIPATEEEINDLLAIYDSESVESLVNFDYSRGRVSARVRNIDSDQGEDIKAAILAWAWEHLPPGQQVIVTGTTLLALKTNDHLVKNLTYSFALAFIIIFISMILLFKSIRLAALSILPNVLPLLVVGGFMGLAGIKLRPTTAMTFAIAFGIAVDDTIHILARFRQEFKRNQGRYRPALRHTLLTTGKAVISTTAVLYLGFSVLLFSDFVPQYQFGALAGLILLIALLASITLLPVLINLARPKLKV
jgi:hydrophobe/amphiphile efflux-3 (HAE3) family protein